MKRRNEIKRNGKFERDSANATTGNAHLFVNEIGEVLTLAPQQCDEVAMDLTLFLELQLVPGLVRTLSAHSSNAVNIEDHEITETITAIETHGCCRHFSYANV